VKAISLEAVTTSPDLHVVSLQYALRSSDHCSYVNAPALDFETGEARFRLSGGQWTCEMKTHFATVDAARSAAEPILRAWEVEAELRFSRGELRFAFKGADVVDRTPKPPGTIHGTAYMVQAPAMLSACGTVSVHVTRNQYPDPPSSFRLNGDAQIVLDHYNRYLDGHEQLLPMAYFCLTLLEKNAGSRRCAETKYRIDKKVLDALGRLTSNHGDHMTARKASAASPLTSSESAWVQAAVKMLIWQVGTPEAVRSWIKMADLPAI
jgi:hypothetical protein